jgi:hypothetical protein
MVFRKAKITTIYGNFHQIIINFQNFLHDSFLIIARKHDSFLNLEAILL